jgi:hypothetical protein
MFAPLSYHRDVAVGCKEDHERAADTWRTTDEFAAVPLRLRTV